MRFISLPLFLICFSLLCGEGFARPQESAPPPPPDKKTPENTAPGTGDGATSEAPPPPDHKEEKSEKAPWTEKKVTVTQGATARRGEAATKKVFGRKGGGRTVPAAEEKKASKSKGLKGALSFEFSIGTGECRGNRCRIIDNYDDDLAHFMDPAVQFMVGAFYAPSPMFSLGLYYHNAPLNAANIQYDVLKDVSIYSFGTEIRVGHTFKNLRLFALGALGIAKYKQWFEGNTSRFSGVAVSYGLGAQYVAGYFLLGVVARWENRSWDFDVEEEVSPGMNNFFAGITVGVQLK